MLYCNVFPASRYDIADLVGLKEDTVTHIHQQRTALFSKYPTDELLELYSVARFMRETIVAINDEDSVSFWGVTSDVIDALLGTGPSGLTRAWESRSISDLEDEELYWLFTESSDENTLNIGYFSVPLANIWKVRDVKLPNEDEPASKHILNTVIGANDTCEAVTDDCVLLMSKNRFSMRHPRWTQTTQRSQYGFFLPYFCLPLLTHSQIGIASHWHLSLSFETSSKIAPPCYGTFHSLPTICRTPTNWVPGSQGCLG